MKKVLIFLVTLLVIFISGCSKKLEGYTEISYNELMKKKENGETFPLVIGSEECSACANYEITMNSFISRYQVEVFLIDLIKLEESDYNELKTEISFTGTPTTVFYEDGELTSFFNRIDGSASKSTVESYFKNNNYIK